MNFCPPHFSFLALKHTHNPYLLLLGGLLLDLDLLLLLNLESDGVADELGVLLDDIADALVLEVLELVLLEEQLDGRAARHRGVGDRLDRERTARRRLPQVLLVVVVLGGDLCVLCMKCVRARIQTTRFRD